MKIFYTILLLIGTIPQADKLNSITSIGILKTQIAETAFQSDNEPIEQIGHQKHSKKKNLAGRFIYKLIEKKLKKIFQRTEKGDLNITALLALIFGALSLVFLLVGVEALVYVGVAAAIAAIVLGIISPKKSNGRKDWKAITGLILGIAAVLLIILAIIIAIALIGAIFGGA